MTNGGKIEVPTKNMTGQAKSLKIRQKFANIFVQFYLWEREAINNNEKSMQLTTFNNGKKLFLFRIFSSQII